MEIQEVLANKVSKERICKEIDNMIIHPIFPRPALSLALLHHLQLLSIILPIYQYFPPYTTNSTSTNTSTHTSTSGGSMEPEYRLSAGGCHTSCQEFFNEDGSLRVSTTTRLPSTSTTTTTTTERIEVHSFLWEELAVEIVAYIQCLQYMRYNNHSCSCQVEVEERKMNTTASSSVQLLPFPHSIDEYLNSTYSIETTTATIDHCQCSRNLFWSGLLIGLGQKNGFMDRKQRIQPFAIVILRDWFKVDNQTVNKTKKKKKILPCIIHY
jgi:hypothetical protein